MAHLEKSWSSRNSAAMSRSPPWLIYATNATLWAYTICADPQSSQTIKTWVRQATGHIDQEGVESGHLWEIVDLIRKSMHARTSRPLAIAYATYMLLTRYKITEYQDSRQWSQKLPLVDYIEFFLLVRRAEHAYVTVSVSRLISRSFVSRVRHRLIGCWDISFIQRHECRNLVTESQPSNEFAALVAALAESCFTAQMLVDILTAGNSEILIVGNRDQELTYIICWLVYKTAVFLGTYL